MEKQRKSTPLPSAGAAALSRVSGAATGEETSPYTAEVREHNGTPTLFLDGQPEFYACHWCAATAPQPEEWGLSEQAREISRETDIHIYAFDIRAFGQYFIKEKASSSRFDFSTVKPSFEQIVKSDPKARFHLRIYVETREQWWTELYPEECEVTSLGRQDQSSYASQVWRRQARDFLRAFEAHIRNIGMAERIVAYHIGAGHTGEWVKTCSSMAGPCGDYSKPMRSHFRAYLGELYSESEGALRDAWSNPDVTFDTCEVPTVDEQLNATNYIFRDPSLEQNVIDYFNCLAELCADLIIDFCKTLKEASDGKAPTAAFYGYLLDLAWNAGFFEIWQDRWWESQYSTTQRSGHLGLRKVLLSPYVDYLASPYSYGFRGIGGVGPSMIPAEAARVHGKLVIVEEDSRLHLDSDDNSYGAVFNVQDCITVCRRNFSQLITRGEGGWWLLSEMAKHPRFRSELKKYQELGSFSVRHLERSPSAEIAVLLDDESFVYETVRNNVDIPLVIQQRHEGLPRLGAPFDIYMLDDLIEGRMRPYKLYVFLNAFRLDRRRREALKQELRRDGRVALWIYAPGYIDGDLSTDYMTDLTGFRFGMSKQPWIATMHVMDFEHPITAGISQDFFWGVSNLISPLFYIEDPDARILGQVLHSVGRCVPGMGIKSYPEWTSIFISAPNVPAPVLRGIARFSGVHIYSEAGDVLDVSRQLLGVQTISGGNRAFNLPGKVQRVWDLYEEKAVAQDADRFDVVLPAKSSALFYTGDADTLSKLEVS